jgi:hypothetical protein
MIKLFENNPSTKDSLACSLRFYAKRHAMKSQRQNTSQCNAVQYNLNQVENLTIQSLDDRGWDVVEGGLVGTSDLDSTLGLLELLDVGLGVPHVDSLGAIDWETGDLDGRLASLLQHCLLRILLDCAEAAVEDLGGFVILGCGFDG